MKIKSGMSSQPIEIKQLKRDANVLRLAFVIGFIVTDIILLAIYFK